MKIKMYLSKLLKLLVLGLIFNSAFAENPSKEELKRMNVFMSNFFEAGIGSIDIEHIEYNEDKKLFNETINQLVEFGIDHNDINNYQKFNNSSCPEMENYSGLKVEDVKETVNKYFGYKLKDNNLPNFLDSNSYKFENNCYYKIIACCEPGSFAKVDYVEKLKDGIVIMIGKRYTYESTGSTSDDDTYVSAYFIAKAKEKTYKGKKTWELISLKTIYN